MTLRVHLLQHLPLLLLQTFDSRNDFAHLVLTLSFRAADRFRFVYVIVELCLARVVKRDATLTDLFLCVGLRLCRIRAVARFYGLGLRLRGWAFGSCKEVRGGLLLYEVVFLGARGLDQTVLLGNFAIKLSLAWLLQTVFGSG